MPAIHFSSCSPADLIAHTEFKTFGEFRPTSLDCAGLGADGREAWLVVPMTYQRKISSILDDSNWAALGATLTEADPETVDHECHLFGHWTTDFEIYVVRPGSMAHRMAEQFTAALSDYCVADEEDYSAREQEAALECIRDGLASLTIEANGADVNDDDLVSAVWRHMSDTQTGNLDCVGQDGGGGPDREECEAALDYLGYAYCEDDMTWRPKSECELVDAE